MKKIQIMKSTVNLELIDEIKAQKENVEVYYATENIDKNSDKWTKEIANIQEVKKVKIIANEVNPGETIPIDYMLRIPENMIENEVAYQITMLNYEYQGRTFETYSNIKLMTQESINNTKQIVNQNLDGVVVNVKASTVEKEIANGDSVLEGQTIRYNVEVRNTTQTDFHDFSIEGFQTDAEGNQNVTFFNMKKLQEYNPRILDYQTSTRYKGESVYC